MGWIGETLDSIRSLQIRQVVSQAISLACWLGMIVTSALIIWKGLMCITGSESPVVVVLSGSMEPGFKWGDILFLRMSKEPIRAGEIVVFNIDGGSSRGCKASSASWIYRNPLQRGFCSFGRRGSSGSLTFAGVHGFPCAGERNSNCSSGSQGS